MALENLLSLSFTTDELDAIDNALMGIETILASKKMVNLSADERKQYGSIQNSNKTLVDKCRDYMQQRPDLVPPFLDMPEFERDYAARKQIELRYRRINSIQEQLSDAKVLLDYDNYQNALTFYRNIRYLAGESVPGSTSIYDDLRQHFQRSRSTTSSNNSDTSNANTTTSETSTDTSTTSSDTSDT